jgi:hypothetical protein
MASGRIHPKQQIEKRRRGTEAVNGTANVAEVIRPAKRAKEARLAPGKRPHGWQEQASITVAAEMISPADSISAGAKFRAKNSAGAQSEAVPGNVRFHVSFHAKLAKKTEFSVGVFSSDTNRGEIAIESIHVNVHRKGESLFDGDVPLGVQDKVNPGGRKFLPFSDAQNTQLSRVLKSKTFASVSAVYTAPPQTEVTFSIANEDSKKKESNS